MNELIKGKGWVHTCCALNIPEVAVVNGQVDIQNIKKERFKETCIACVNPTGAVVKCGVADCKNYFHPYCAIRSLEKNFFFNILRKKNATTNN